MTQTDAQTKIARRLYLNGALSIAEFMALAVGDKDCGYYARAEPFGSKGDFITAPEISQLFGELIGVWVAAVWEAIGRPQAFALAEGGPGRGALCDDMLRALAKVAPDCLRAAGLILMETSPALQQRQQQMLAKHKAAGLCAAPPQWVEDFPALAARAADKPLIFIANELLDALPVHQYQKSAQGWHERLIKADAAGGLQFALGPAQAAPAFMRSAGFAELCRSAADGAIAEVSPAREALVRGLSRLIAKNRGAALLIDYGSLTHGFGDTLQAVSRHRFSSALENIGRSDISSHVNFAALTETAKNASCHCTALTQGEFLLALGLLERAGRLGADKDEAARGAICAAVERLAAPGQMGALFKTLCIADLKTHMPVFQ